MEYIGLYNFENGGGGGIGLEEGNDVCCVPLDLVTSMLTGSGSAAAVAVAVP